jgi:hypothetical protein
MPWFFISSGFQTRIKLRLAVIPLSFQFSGIKACWSLLNGRMPLASGILKTSTDPSVHRRYASDLTPDQKDALLDVIRATPHPQISAEIRRELVNSVERGAPRTQSNQDVDMS